MAATWQSIKKDLRGVTLVFWRAGTDTIHETTGRTAHRIVQCQIDDGDECDVSFSRIGKTAWIDEKSWSETQSEEVQP